MPARVERLNAAGTGGTRHRCHTSKVGMITMMRTILPLALAAVAAARPAAEKPNIVMLFGALRRLLLRSDRPLRSASSAPLVFLIG
jgi:hypothetical protein